MLPNVKSKNQKKKTKLCMSIGSTLVRLCTPLPPLPSALSDFLS